MSSTDEGAAPKRQIPRPPPDAVVLSAGEEDGGKLEVLQIGSGRSTEELKKEAEEKERGRTEKFRDHFEFAAILALWGLFGAMAILGVVWIWHLITPTCNSLHWLSESQLEKLQDVLTGGIIAGLVGDHFKRRMERH